MEDQVYPITKNVEEQNSTVLLKKLTRYFDSKTMEYKDQPNIKFSLKVTNPKLDEIAKDEKSRVELKEWNLQNGKKDSDRGLYIRPESDV